MLAGSERVERHVTCLGCGCACDDIEISVRDGRIEAARHACPLGVAWFSDGTASTRARAGGKDVPLSDAVSGAARLLAGASRPLVYLAPELTSQAQRQAAALADICRAVLDSVSSASVAESVLSSQETGRATATLGEVRNRADVILFWDVDRARYPRFGDRYAPDVAGLYVPKGRAGRLVAAVSVRHDAWPGANVVVRVPPADEVTALAALATLVDDPDATIGAHPGLAGARHLARILRAGQYVAVVADMEPAPLGSSETVGRAAALWRLSHALNHHMRGAVVPLRAGGNRSGAEAVMTSSAGYPMTVDFARGVPAFRPYDASARRLLATGGVDAVLVAGEARQIPADVLAGLRSLPCVVVGPGASDGPLSQCAVVIDTARAGIHEAGVALRMDDVPLPLRALLPGPPAAADILSQVVEKLVAARQAGGRT